ncbi:MULTISPECIES: hypothetical protein [Enterobacter]|uniref:hypothetical protein n=1 Tax=Enterobacter TaxID=547 RepID=UPI0021CB153F|nr:hypothetical protein [Enterobacter sp. 155105]UXP22289.1 hypothetical protein N8O08_13385 [Enterobacter sp. 155105]
MDFTTFVSKAIDSLAWPLLFFYVVHRHKDVLIGLLKSLTSLKIGEHFNATFSAQADKVAKESEKELPQEVSNEQLSIEERLLRLPPRLAILDAWKMVEDAVISSINVNNLMTDITMKEEVILRHPLKAANLLKYHGYLNGKQANLMNDLRLMRNKVVHGAFGIEPSSIDAENYVRSAISFVSLLGKEGSSPTAS